MPVKFEMSPCQVEELKTQIALHKQKPGPLMPTLHDAQKIFGCIPLEVQKIISEELDEPVAKINGVVSFYSHFTVEPKGKHIINVCLGTACYVRGSQDIINTLSDLLQIKPGETTQDGKFTLAANRCIGACGLAPVFTVDGKVYGTANTKVAQNAVESILKAID
ncbi:MAG: NAD(P)H-dependent oxidoreductase subunit E [Bacilli bacterium]|jgi:NADH:ubiquinone oxidoreductase subunit E|nr:NAD(P)H-dependent oxidoreductase subunit E [Bacilli bacterium]